MNIYDFYTQMNYCSNTGFISKNPLTDGDAMEIDNEYGSLTRPKYEIVKHYDEEYEETTYKLVLVDNKKMEKGEEINWIDFFMQPDYNKKIGVGELHIPSEALHCEVVKGYGSIRVICDETKLLIQPFAFWGNDFIDDVVTLGGNIGIGEYAFSGSNVREVHIPDSLDLVYRIGNDGDNYVEGAKYSNPAYAFSGCDKLKVFDAPNLVNLRGENMFDRCKIDTLYFPNLYRAEDGVFAGVELKILDAPNLEYAPFAFSEDTDIEYINAPKLKYRGGPYEDAEMRGNSGLRGCYLGPQALNDEGFTSGFLGDSPDIYYIKCDGEITGQPIEDWVWDEETQEGHYELVGYWDVRWVTWQASYALSEWDSFLVPQNPWDLELDGVTPIDCSQFSNNREKFLYCFKNILLPSFKQYDDEFEHKVVFSQEVYDVISQDAEIMNTFAGKGWTVEAYSPSYDDGGDDGYDDGE